jgi:hypothetical protein
MADVELSPKTHALLQQMAVEEGCSASDLLDQAINKLWRTRFLERANEAFAALRADPVAWQEELDEMGIWDCTLMDGLEDEEPQP